MIILYHDMMFKRIIALDDYNNVLRRALKIMLKNEF